MLRLHRSFLARPTRYTTKVDPGSQTPLVRLFGVSTLTYIPQVSASRGYTCTWVLITGYVSIHPFPTPLSSSYSLTHPRLVLSYTHTHSLSLSNRSTNSNLALIQYASWQPIATNKATIGTKAPYYGNIAVASFLAPPPSSPYDSPTTSLATVKHLPISSTPFLSAYAAYHSSNLTRLILINLQSYNTTASGEGLAPLPPSSLTPRPSVTFNFTLPAAYLLKDGGKEKQVVVKRLMANGSDAITGITWDGWSYNWELDEGRPVRLANVTRTSESERAWVGEGTSDGGKAGLGVVVEAGSAALVEFV